MNEVAQRQPKARGGVPSKKAPQQASQPQIRTEIAKKRVLVIGLGDNQHRLKNKLSKDSHFENSRRKALAFLRQHLGDIDIVVALPHNLGGVGIEDEVWATGFTGHFFMTTDARSFHANYAGKGHIVMVNEMPEKVFKKLNKK